jgi:hypothetical protein
MNYKLSTLLLYFLLSSSTLHAAQVSIPAIIEAEGYACMGDDKSKKQTEQIALADAKRKAAEAALTYVKSETKVQDAELQKDVVAAYSNALIKIVQELNKTWYKDASAGDCYKIKIMAEVMPDMEAIKASGKINAMGENAMGADVKSNMSMGEVEKALGKPDKVETIQGSTDGQYENPTVISWYYAKYPIRESGEEYGKPGHINFVPMRFTKLESKMAASDEIARKYGEQLDAFRTYSYRGSFPTKKEYWDVPSGLDFIPIKDVGVKSKKR